MDFEEGFVAGAVVAGTAAATAAAVTAGPTTTVTYVAALPCTPVVVVAGGVSYYQCGTTWYTQTVVNGTATYVVSTTPPPAH